MASDSGREVKIAQTLKGEKKGEGWAKGDVKGG